MFSLKALREDATLMLWLLVPVGISLGIPQHVGASLQPLPFPPNGLFLVNVCPYFLFEKGHLLLQIKDHPNPE